jgi:hypothetical protein
MFGDFAPGLGHFVDLTGRCREEETQPCEREVMNLG